MIDILIMQAVTWPLLLVVFIPVLGTLGWVTASTRTNSEPDPNVVAAGLFGILGLVLLVVLATVILQIAYEVVLTTIWGMTLGKRAVGIRVRSITEDRNPTWLESGIRAGVMVLGGALGSGVFTLIDYLWPLWDKPWQQTLHDKAAKTIVVPR